MLLACVLATRRNPYFWYDEVATATLLADPSLGHVLRAISHGAENNPPLYVLLLRGWAAVFGTSALALRLPSALAFAAALAVTWRTLRRAYPTRAAAMGTAAVFFGAPVIFEQLAQARYYGLLTCTAALAFGLAALAVDRGRASRGLLLATFLSHLALVGTHTFGPVFSGALLVAMVALGVRRGRLDHRLYLAVVAAWIPFALWAPLILEGAREMTGPSWIPRPQRDDLVRLLAGQAVWFPFIAAGAVVLGVIAGRSESPAPDLGVDETLHRRRETLVALGVAMIAVVFAIFVISRVAVPIFLDRYLLPAAIGWTVVTAHVVTAIAGGRGVSGLASRRTGAVYAVVYGALALYPVAFAVSLPRAERPSLRVSPELGALPVVVEAGHDFVPLHYYAETRPGRYRFLLDRASATAPGNAAGATQEFVFMSLYDREGYFDDAVEPAMPFLCTTPRFLVIDRPDFVLYERLIATDTTLSSHQVSTYDGAPVRLVARNRPCPQTR